MAPVRITMAASVISGPHSGAIPSCSFYDEATGGWDSAGLATDSMTVSPSGNGTRSEVNLTCFSFHLSDFTVSADELDAAFRPVSLVRFPPDPCPCDIGSSERDPKFVRENPLCRQTLLPS